MVKERNDEQMPEGVKIEEVQSYGDMEMLKFSSTARWATKKSLWMVHFCTGCGGIELPPLMTSR